VFPGTQGGPLVHIMAGESSLLPRGFAAGIRVYAEQVITNARVLGRRALRGGFRVVSGGTDTHLLLVDVFSKGVRGKDAQTDLRRRLPEPVFRKNLSNEARDLAHLRSRNRAW